MKTSLSAPSAVALLAKEFKRQKSPACRACAAPMPFWGPAPHNADGIWYLKALPPCPHGCHALVARIWVEITGQYTVVHSAPGPAGRSREKIRAPVRERFTADH